MMKRYPMLVWTVLLIATCVGVVPLAVMLLQRTLTAARAIERYTGEMLASGVDVAQHTASVAALKDTLAVAPQLVGGTDALVRHVASIASALDTGAQGNGRVAPPRRPS